MAHLVDGGVEEHLELVAHPLGRVRADEVGEEVLKRLGRRKVREGGDDELPRLRGTKCADMKSPMMKCANTKSPDEIAEAEIAG